MRPPTLSFLQFPGGAQADVQIACAPLRLHCIVCHLRQHPFGDLVIEELWSEQVLLFCVVKQADLIATDRGLGCPPGVIDLPAIGSQPLASCSQSLTTASMRGRTKPEQNLMAFRALPVRMFDVSHGGGPFCSLLLR